MWAFPDIDADPLVVAPSALMDRRVSIEEELKALESRVRSQMEQLADMCKGCLDEAESALGKDKVMMMMMLLL